MALHTVTKAMSIVGQTPVGHRRMSAKCRFCCKSLLKVVGLSDFVVVRRFATGAEQIPRDLHEDARDVARALAKTEAYEQSRRNRKRVEMLFAHLKRILKLGRLRLRGPYGAQDEFTLAAIAQNLRRLAKLIARPPPVADACPA